MKQILIVDDNLTNLKYISNQLSGLYHALLAKSGHQALFICSAKQPDLVLLDIDMPGMDGFETLEQLKKNPQTKGIPVIFLTATEDLVAEARALESGAVDFITKPVEPRVLLHRINLHLELSGYQKDLEHKVKELEDSIVVSFAELIECRDEDTGDHVQRTSRYVNLLGRELIDREYYSDILTLTELDKIVRAAPLHDIGKIGISDTILLKPGKLTNEEFAIMKTHTRLGGRMLRKIYERTPTQSYLSWAITIAEGHHEKFDGSGYPEGLSGTSIPIGCRIMAVADVYDALCSERAYRKALQHEEAIGIMQTGEGSHFDPLILHVFLELEEQIKQIAKVTG